jgi:LPS sulfotransferase NodH
LRPGDLHAVTLVLSAPRTGSTLLCRDLASLGGFGSPREYLRDFDPAAGPDAITDRLAQGVQDETPGVGAAKVMIQQARPVAQAITGRPVLAADAMTTVVRWAQERFDQVCVIILVRNALDQAISRAVAEATGVYHSTSKRYRTDREQPLDDVDINQAILTELKAVVRDRVALQATVGELGDSALLLTYDELTARPEETTRRIAAHARAHGLEPTRDAPTRRLTKVIGTARAEALRQGFLDYLASEPGV